MMFKAKELHIEFGTPDTPAIAGGPIDYLDLTRSVSERIGEITAIERDASRRHPMVAAFLGGVAACYLVAGLAFYGLIATAMPYLPGVTAAGIAAMWPASFGQYLFRDAQRPTVTIELPAEDEAPAETDRPS